MRLMNRFGAIHYFPDYSVFYSTILANEEFDLLLHYFEWFGRIRIDILGNYLMLECTKMKWTKMKIFLWILLFWREIQKMYMDLRHIQGRFALISVAFWLNFGDWCKNWDLKSYGLGIFGGFWEFSISEVVKKHVFLENMSH